MKNLLINAPALLAALSLATLTACGSSSPGGESVSGGGSAGGGTAGGGSSTGGSGIQTAGGGAKVNGISYDYRGDLRYFTAGDRFTINMENLDESSRVDHQESWTLGYFSPTVGTYSCNNSGTPGEDSPVVILDRQNSPFGSSANGGDCTITVTSADAEGFEGTFSGTIAESDAAGAPRYNVQDGHFQVAFVDVIPDADADELSDADDNCPFHANPGQADADNDGVGDACEQEED